MDPPDGRGTRGRSLPAAAAAGSAVSGMAAALTATAASACCVGPAIAPAVVSVLGAGGAAWAAGLKPYSPLLLATSGLLVGFSFWGLYGRRGPACDAEEAGGAGRARRGRRLLVGVVWFSALIWIAALGLNLWLGVGPAGPIR